MRPPRRWGLLAHTVAINSVLGVLGFNYISMVVTEVQADLGIEVGRWGVLWSGISFGILLSSIPGGVLGDRFGVRRVAATGLVISGGSLLLRASAGDFVTMLITMALHGMGLGIVSANVPKALGIWLPPEKLGLALT